jgi:hypothetical protein
MQPGSLLSKGSGMAAAGEGDVLLRAFVGRRDKNHTRRSAKGPAGLLALPLLC